MRSTRKLFYAWEKCLRNIFSLKKLSPPGCCSFRTAGFFYFSCGCSVSCSVDVYKRQVFGRFTGAGSMALLHSAPFPSDLISLGVEGISGIWKQMKLRGIGRKRAQRIYEAAQTSVGCTTGMEAARMELQILLEDYDAKLQQYERVMQVVENLCSQIPAVAELLKIQGLGRCV